MSDFKTLTTVAKSQESGIIKVESASMFRKSSVEKIEPMHKKQFHRIEKRFKKQDEIFQYNDETSKHLESKHTKAITYDAKTILYKQNPGRAGVFEEFIHTFQYTTGENDGGYISRLKCEISAHKKLLKYSKAYKLTKPGIIQTEKALKAYE